MYLFPHSRAEAGGDSGLRVVEPGWDSSVLEASRTGCKESHCCSCQGVSTKALSPGAARTHLRPGARLQAEQGKGALDVEPLPRPDLDPAVPAGQPLHAVHQHPLQTPRVLADR